MDWRGTVTPTWKHTQRGFWRRAEWGVLTGLADLFAGTVSVLTLGQCASWLPTNVTFTLAMRESRRAQEGS